VDASRIYVAGIGAGGMMAMRLALESPDSVAAVACFFAGMSPYGECQAKGFPVPIWMLNATGDPVQPWHGGDLEPKGGMVRSVAQTGDYWVSYNRADRRNARMRQWCLPLLDDQGIVRHWYYPALPGGADVERWELHGWGREVPSPASAEKSQQSADQVFPDGLDAAWSFLSRYALGHATALPAPG
jgi:poly(3-hydroxybutyrate) depolymerase